MASVNNLLPGAKKSIPYISDTGMLALWYHSNISDQVGSYIPLEDAGIEQGTRAVEFIMIVSNNSFLQKFRLYVLESEKGTDIVAYVLAYFIDIKDKPRE